MTATMQERLEMFGPNSDILTEMEKLWYAGKVTFDWNGHNRCRKTQPVVPRKYEYPFRRDFGHEERLIEIVGFGRFDVDMKPFAAAIKKKKWHTVKFNANMMAPQCFDCGARLNEWQFNGSVMRPTNKCPYPKGHPPIVTEIEVKSGVLVFANYFQGFNSPPDIEGRALPGWKVEQEFHAKQKLLHGFCGNSCPTIFKNGSRFIIGRPAEVGEKGFPGYTVAGGVITDAWCWQAACLNTVKKKHKGGKQIKVPNGRYRMEQRVHLIDRDDKTQNRVFATIRKV